MTGLHDISSLRAPVPGRTLSGRSDVGRVPYLPGLDGLRALAVVAVMIYHANHEWLGGGFLGVEVFFVISGYLITLLLVGEHERTGRVALGQFWLRRFRRLLPALFVMMAGLAVYMSLFHRRPQGQTRGDFLGGIFYGSNWYQIAVGQGYTAAEAFAPLRHLWSLAVEEQFYLAWPLVMVLILRRGAANLPRVAVWLLGVSLTIAVVTAVLFAGGDVATTCAPGRMNGYWELFGRCISTNEALYLSTFTRAGGLMLGAAFAMVWRPGLIGRGDLRDKGRLLDVLAGAGVALLALLMWALTLSGNGHDFGIRFNPWLFRGGFFVTGVATILVIAAAAHPRAATGTLLGNPVFLWIGTRSYGLYLYHWPVYQIIREAAGSPLTVGEFVLAMAISLPITELSYRYIETPIRRGRLGEIFRRTSIERARDRERRRSLTIVIAGLVFLVSSAAISFGAADNLCVGDVACSLVDAETANQTTTTGAVDPATTRPGGGPTPTGTGTDTGTTAPLDPALTTTTVAATITTVDLDAILPIAFGESVMAGASGQLLDGGFVVDAAEDRQGPEMADELRSMRTQNRLGRTVVIQIGTNGTVDDETFDEMMQSLPAELTPRVVFLTVRGPDRWIDGNNDRIRALTRYPNVVIADWATVSQSIELCPDGVHISCSDSMAQAYANMIFEAAGMPHLIVQPASGST